MPRYVILEHDHPFLHWDFMLEAGDVLRTWRLLECPRPGRIIAAEALGDHRMAYLEYEGAVGGNRGTVQRWDAGTFAGSLEEERVEVDLAGGRLSGRAVLQRDAAGRWTFAFSDVSRKGRSP